MERNDNGDFDPDLARMLTEVRQRLAVVSIENPEKYVDLAIDEICSDPKLTRSFHDEKVDRVALVVWHALRKYREDESNN